MMTEFDPSSPDSDDALSSSPKALKVRLDFVTDPGKMFMDNWQKDFSEMLETIADHVEDFFLDVARDITEAVNIVFDLSEEISTQLHNDFLDEMELYATELVNPVLEAYFGLGSAVEEAAQPMIATVEPLLKQHPACLGCKHFHGQSYGGNLLICGMHPYGVGEGVETCPDKELTAWGSFTGVSGWES